MSSATKQRCKAVWLLMQRTTEAATTLSRADPPSLDPSTLRKHLLKMCKLHLAIMEANSKLTLEHLAYEETELEQAQFISIFTRLISAVAPLLITLEHAADFTSGSVQVDIFWKVWDLLLCSCQAFNIWPQVWPEATKASNAPLHAALHTLTTWLLPFTRKPNSAWASLLTHQSATHRAEQAWVILTVPVHCFISITSQPSQDRAEALDLIYNLPPDFVATVCCLVCEQLSSTLPNLIASAHLVTATAQPAIAAVEEEAAVLASSSSSAAAAAAVKAAAAAVEAAATATTPSLRTPGTTQLFFTNLALCITCFVNFDIWEGNSHLLGTLSVPSVLQLLKTVVAHFPARIITARAHSDSICAINVFAMMVRKAGGVDDPVMQSVISRAPHSSHAAARLSNNTHTSTGSRGTTASSSSSSSVAGGASRPQPGQHLTTATITTDIQVIRAVGRWLQLDAGAARTGNQAIDAIYTSWDKRRSCSLPAPGLTHQAGCLNLMAHTSMSFARMYARELVRKAGQRAGRFPPRQCTETWHMRELAHAQIAADNFDSDDLFGMDIMGGASVNMLRVATRTVDLMQLRSNCLSGENSNRETGEQRQQRLTITANPDLRTLHAWTQLPGAVATLEATLRWDHSLNRMARAFQSAGKAADFLVLASASPDPAMLPACISLAATLQKMLHSYTHSFDPGSDRHARSTQRKLWAAADGVTHNPTQTAHFLIHELMNAITALDKINELYSSGSPGLRNYRDCSADPVTGNRYSTSNNSPDAVERLICEVTSMASEGTQVNSQGLVKYPFASRRALLVYQLQTVLTGILVPLCHMRVMTGEENPAPWLTPIVRGFGRLRSRLSVVGCTLLAERVFSSGARELVVAICMERFGMAIFGGRLTPGCCHLGCESMGGVSESTLRTWLCGKCRKARYCSRTCQREAWEDGHNTLCGNYKGLHGALL